LEKPIEQIFESIDNVDRNPGGISLGILNEVGGGGNTIQPSPPPPYVPPVPNNPMTIHLIGEDTDLEFLEDGVSKGFGKTIDVVYNTSLQFNGPKTYTANLNNGKVLSKFVVAIKQLQYINGAIDGISVTEYKLVNDNWEEQATQNFNFGSIALRFKSSVTSSPAPPIQPVNPGTITKEITTPNPNVEYEISFASNLQNEIVNNTKLSYQIAYGTTIVDSGKISLGENILKTISAEVINASTVNFQVEGTLPDGITIKQIYGGVQSQYKGNFTNLNKVAYAFSIPASELKSSYVVIVDAEKEIKFAEPKITLSQTQFNVSVKESDTEKSIVIPFTTEQSDNVLVYISETKTISVPSGDKEITLYFQKDFDEIYGSKKIFFVPTSNGFGTGSRKEVIITFTSVNDFPSITETTLPDLIDIPSFSDFNIEFDVEYSTFAATSVDVFLKQKDGSKIIILNNQTPNAKFKINLKKLKETYQNWAGSDNVTLILKPYNRGGAEELIGNDYEIVTKLILPAIHLDNDELATALFDAFSEKLKIVEPELDSKHLTHLANFGNDEQLLISSWENDNWTLSKKSTDELGNVFVKPEDEVKSIILKLYSPLNANIVANSTFWITKLMTNPLIETVILNEQSELKCPPIKGPNFSIDVDFVKGQSTSYESLDNLILDSPSSSELVSTYLSSSLVNTTDLNIEYTSGSTYLWNNFTHFSSAKERVDNFVYKVQLIEQYETLYTATYSTGSTPLSGAHTGSLSSIQERERQLLKKNQLINGFDGFENFLYTSSSMSWPYSGNTRELSTSNNVSIWYEDVIVLAENFDIENPNWVRNNIPQYIVNNEENASLVLFFSMIGQHFDNIYFHTKSIERSRGLGYKLKNGISDKLLFETLKSFNWDANNLSADGQLWNYVFGENSNGTITESNPAKQRTYEVWRRIVNNLPYLLKHKGTKRGIYALLSCYGIPSSNLSILEFGGPEIDNNNSKSKLVMDNITTALRMNSGSYLEMGWQNTNKNKKPNTIELFTKPAYSSNYTLISGSGWNVQLSGSANSEYGKVIFNYSGSTAISSSLLPIFNGKFFGIAVSSGSTGLKLALRQSEKEKTIFEYSQSITGSTNWNNGSKLKIGGNYSGSLDEFRLWSEPLDTQIFYNHVSFPEMVNGNSVSASTTDLYLRLDFEYPKNLAQTASLINVDTNVYFANGLTRNDYESGTTASLYSTNVSASVYVSASGFSNITTYPHNFEAIDRTIVMDYPDGGASRFSTNKVRFEGQTLVSDLSSKTRSTIKAFDQSPTDSNRVGLFFSPTKELNIDIAKSFGGINLDNYIGDPSDDYKPNYSELDSLRNYYFERFNNRNIYEYINLIKLYEKSMFEDIKKMLPARVRATTGLLIEPHFLERSKVAHKKPQGEDYQQDAEIHYSDTTHLFSENLQYKTIVDANLGEKLIGENEQYEALILDTVIENITAENEQYDSLIDFNQNLIIEADAFQRETLIDANLQEPTIQTEIDLINSNVLVGQSNYEEIGFGLYAERGVALRTYYNKDGGITKERVKVNLITTQKSRDIVVFNFAPNGVGDPRGGYRVTSSVYTETELNIQNITGSVPGVSGSIVKVIPLDGYLPTHNKFVNDLTTGMQNSYYLGSKNTAATTLDGTPPVEVFATNPNTLKVNKAGRAANEPILEVE
jgi:hypothetical protein